MRGALGVLQQLQRLLGEGNRTAANRGGMPAPMTTFLASYQNGVDRKGRVSVPASFRAEMAGHARQTVVVYVAPQVAGAAEGNNKKGTYLYAWAYDDFVKLAERIAQLPALSPTRQRLARTILAAARPLNFDDAGRIMLPESMMQAAGITEQVMFAGEGEYFTLWEPSTFEAQIQSDLTFADQDLADLNEVWKINS